MNASRASQNGDKVIRTGDGNVYDISEFWTGRSAVDSSRPSAWGGDFSGRPELAENLLPAFSMIAAQWSHASFRQCVLGMRNFFRFLDQYEAALSERIEFPSITEAIGFLWKHPLPDTWKPATRSAFRVVGQLFRAAHALLSGENHQFAWPVTEDRRSPSDEREIPNKEESRAAITLLKREAHAIFDRWKRADALAASGRNLLNQPYSGRGFGFTVTEADLHATYRAIIERTGVAVPNFREIRKAFRLAPGRTLPSFWAKSRIGLLEIQAGLYPTTRDLYCLTQLFMARTGWNPSTVYALDIGNDDWAITHGDPSHDLWMIESWKKRSLEWQQTICRGRVSSGPYSIIAKLLDRTATLRAWIRSGGARICGASSPGELLRSAWISASEATNWAGHIGTIATNGAAPSEYWHELVANHNADVDRRNGEIDRANTKILHSVSAYPAILPQRRYVRIPEGMVPSDWRDIYADFVFVDSRYAWVVVQWALGHKHILTTRHYLRRKLWRRFSEERLLDVQAAIVGELRHARLDAVVIRARAELGYIPDDADIERLNASRKRIRESELTYSGYWCENPRNPPVEIDPGNPSDGSTLCRRGERCAGCPVAIAADSFHMTKRAVELELLKARMSVTMWSDSHLGADLDVLLEDLKQWPADEIDRHRAFWREEFRSGRRLLNPWSSMN